ncbi:MAG: tetratricopeptide repeat protein [Dehalococcoidia bacterium]
MKCPECEAEGLPDGASFCMSCGARLQGAAGREPSVTRLHVDQKIERIESGSAVGYEIQQVRGDVHIEGHVVLQLPQDMDLSALAAIPTEVKPGAAAGMAGSQSPERASHIDKKLDQVLDLMRDLDKRGEHTEQVQSGETRVSRVDLLLKKAVIIKSQADQMMLDSVGDNRHQVDYSAGQVDLADLLEGFESAGHEAKLREAYSLLEEALEIDPGNTEVLLHMAELLMELTEDDPTDEQRLLYQVQSLLRNPKDDVERFRLAQATFLLATSHEPAHVDSLRTARDMFQRLGRTDWVRHCDDLIGSLSGGGPQAAQFGHTTGSSFQQPSQQPRFQPQGLWHIQVMDAVGSVITAMFAPDGTFQATQTLGQMGAPLQAYGRWMFNPMHNMLQLQGVISGMQQFMLGIMIHGTQGNGYYGVGTDGIAYVLTPGQP